MSGIYIQIPVGTGFIFIFIFIWKKKRMDNYRHFFCVFDKMSVGAELELNTNEYM